MYENFIIPEKYKKLPLVGPNEGWRLEFDFFLKKNTSDTAARYCRIIYKFSKDLHQPESFKDPNFVVNNYEETKDKHGNIITSNGLRNTALKYFMFFLGYSQTKKEAVKEAKILSLIAVRKAIKSDKTATRKQRTVTIEYSIGRKIKVVRIARRLKRQVKPLKLGLPVVTEL